MFHVLKYDASYAAGAHKIAGARSRAEAERKAAAFDTKLNGRAMGKTFVLDEREFEEWNNRNVAPFYQTDR